MKTPRARKPRPLLHLSTRVFGTPLAILPAKMSAIMAGIGPRLLGLEPALWDDDPEQDDEEKEPEVRDDGIARIRVHGTLVRRSSGMNAMSGMTSYESLESQIVKAADDSNIRAIFFDTDSPGGETDHLLELGDLIYSLRGSKPMMAACDSSMCSAAYVLGSAAGRTYITRLGMIGSCGCFVLHCDQSALDARAGLKYSYIFSGAQKVDFNEHSPLSDRARMEMQSEVNRIRDLLCTAVARNRGVSVSAVLATEAGVRFGPAAIPLFADETGGCDDALEDLTAMLPAAPSYSLPAPSQPALPAAQFHFGQTTAAPTWGWNNTVTIYPRLDPSAWLAGRTNIRPTAALTGVAARLQGEEPAMASRYGQVEARVLQFPRSRATVATASGQGSRLVRLLVAPNNSLSVDLGGFREIYQPGCFAAGLADTSSDPLVLHSHDEQLVLGRKSAGTARFWEDSIGLWCEADTPDTSWGDDLIESIRRSDIASASASFWITKAAWGTMNGERVRIIQGAILREASVLALPAYLDTSATIGPAAVKALPAPAASGGMTNTDRAWLKLIELAEGPMSPDVAAAKLKLIGLGWRPRTK